MVAPTILGEESMEVVAMVPILKGDYGKVVVVEYSGELLQPLSYCMEMDLKVTSE